MSEARRHSTGQATTGHPAASYLIARESNGSEVLCISSAPGEKTLPAFTSREAARRFLRSGPLRFGLLDSGWRVRKFSVGELASLLFGPYPGVRRVVLDPSPEALVGICTVMPIRNVVGLAL